MEISTSNSLCSQLCDGLTPISNDSYQILLGNLQEYSREITSQSHETLQLLNILVCKRLGHQLLNIVKLITQNGFKDMDCGIASSKLRGIAGTLLALRWCDIFREQYMWAMVSIIDENIRSIINEKENDEIVKPDIELWLKSSLFPYAKLFFGTESFTEKIQKELQSAMINQIALRRSENLFEMIAEYPDSLIGLKELRDCIKLSNTVGIVGKDFRSVLQKRLLHMGAATTQILDFYVSMIKALRVLDSSDFLLNFVAAPVRKYLQGRKDAVRCIVASLTEGKESELHSELKQGGSLAYAADEDDEECGPGLNWEPHKRNRELVEPASKSDAAARGLDTLALLVSIYGSTDLFITEYRSLLADKLISNVGYTTDLEVANLELLKIRFGEESLHSCEVMLKDIEDSRRANNAVHSELTRASTSAASSSSTATSPSHIKTVDYVIVSDNYWPSIPKDAICYHPEVVSLLQQYQNTFAVLKKPRKLHPAQTLGQVEMELDFEDGTTRLFLVSPMQANVIMFFQEAIPTSLPLTLSLHKLSALCEVEEDELFSAGVHYWVTKGVLREVTEEVGQRSGEATPSSSAPYMGYEEGPERFFQVVEEQEGLLASDLSMNADAPMHQESKLSSAANAQQKAALVQIEAFVKGLLAGHGTMSLERLHSMLKLLSGGGNVSDVHFDMNTQQLRQFLQGLESAGKIEYMEGVYALCQQPATSTTS